VLLADPLRTIRRYGAKIPKKSRLEGTLSITNEDKVRGGDDGIVLVLGTWEVLRSQHASDPETSAKGQIT